MTLWESVLLGVVQGLGEFLPISSSAHLIITPWLFGFKDPGLTFDVALHFGTLLAILSYFWRDWVHMVVGATRTLFCKKKLKEINQTNEAGAQARLFWYLVLATIPGALIGLALESYAETSFRHPLLIAFNMSLLGALLFWVDATKRGSTEITNVSLKQALLIGFSQALALIPGVSRSGITMTTGLLAGLNRVSAARFSFLLATPITVGACVLKAKEFFSEPVSMAAVVGIVVSAVVGFLSIRFLLRYVQVRNYRPFCYYRFGFTVVVVAVYFFRN